MHAQMTEWVKVVAITSSFIPKLGAQYGLNLLYNRNFGIMV